MYNDDSVHVVMRAKAKGASAQVNADNSRVLGNALAT